MAKKHPLDGYDYTATVPRGTPLVVSSPDGRVWRLARKGVRYHEDASTLIHGARAARAPAPVAASDRIRAILDSVLLAGGDLPADAGQPIATWGDAPHVAGSLAPTASLAVYADRWVRAVRPVYDDAPRVGARQVSTKEQAALMRDLAAAPRGVRLPTVQVSERTVRIEADDPRVSLAATLPGARPVLSRLLWPRDAGYADALAAPGACLVSGGAVDVPDADTAWCVPVTAWRQRSGLVSP
jgi:hypothetical protein